MAGCSAARSNFTKLSHSHSKLDQPSLVLSPQAATLKIPVHRELPGLQLNLLQQMQGRRRQMTINPISSSARAGRGWERLRVGNERGEYLGVAKGFDGSQEN